MLKLKLAEAETLVAITGEFYGNKRGYNRFYNRHADAISGFPGVWSVLIDAAGVFEKVSKRFGAPGEHYDWPLATENFAMSLHNAKDLTAAEYERMAGQAIAEAKY